MRFTSNEVKIGQRGKRREFLH